MSGNPKIICNATDGVVLNVPVISKQEKRSFISSFPPNKESVIGVNLWDSLSISITFGYNLWVNELSCLRNKLLI